MILDSILQANKAYQQKRKTRAATNGAMVALVTCFDPRLHRHIPAALGLQPGEYIQISVAGCSQPEGENAILRNACSTAYFSGVKEIFVIGHTDCHMATDALRVSQAMDRAGVDRSALGAADLRITLGLMASPQAGVDRLMYQMRKSAWLPPDVIVHALMMDTNSGALSVASKGSIRSSREDDSLKAESGMGWDIGAGTPSTPLPDSPLLSRLDSKLDKLVTEKPKIVEEIQIMGDEPDIKILSDSERARAASRRPTAPRPVPARPSAPQPIPITRPVRQYGQPARPPSKPRPIPVPPRPQRNPEPPIFIGDDDSDDDGIQIIKIEERPQRRSYRRPRH